MLKVAAFDFWNLDKGRGVKRQQLDMLINIEQDDSWMQEITLSKGGSGWLGMLGAKYGRQIDQIKTANDLDHGGGSAEVVKR